MATADISAFHNMIGKGICEMQWTFAGVTGIGFAMNAQNLPDKVVHVRSDGFNGGTTQVVLQGTNATTPTAALTQWHTLVDVHETSLDRASLATGYIETILDNPRFIRPRVPVASTGVGDIIVNVIAQGQLR